MFLNDHSLRHAISNLASSLKNLKTSALLRSFQKFKDRDTKSFNSCLEIIARSMHSRLMADFESARVRDYSKNIKTLSAKYYYDQDLFKLFCDLVDRDMGMCVISSFDLC